MSSETFREELRSLPSVDQVLRELEHLDHLPRHLITYEIRTVLAERREALRNNLPFEAAPFANLVERRLKRLLSPSLRRVINATGVILHTNLGRAPLDDFQPIGGYSNLEYDLGNGRRGKRDIHTAYLLDRLLGRPAILVNNNAAAVYLTLNELAGGHEVIVSRGELIEIGDGFRIPDIMARSGAVLREIGTTNRTRIEDYRGALSDRTRLIMRVHPSNFKVNGFASRPTLHELAELGRAANIPVYEDLGSGCLVDLRSRGIDEPLVTDSLEAGINVASFSCDKLLGGPQCGIIAGDDQLVHRIRRNPMYRAFRCDKLSIEALSSTMRRLISEDWEAIPTLRMIFEPADEIRARAERVASRLHSLPLAVREGESAVGGGSTPEQVLPTWLIALEVRGVNAFEYRLRHSPVPVIARIEQDRILLDLRTVARQEEDDLIASVQAAALG